MCKRKRRFYSASYEITNKCNFQCQHCYLGEKDNFELDLNRKKEIISRIYEIGCLWLQITGGEATLSKDFEEIYLLAHSLGLMITVSTNGSLISKYQKLFQKYPPYKLAISLYGATQETYKKVTKTSGFFLDVLEGFEYLKLNKLKPIINIILLNDNQAEISAMKKIVGKYGFNYHIYDEIAPTLFSLNNPLDYVVQCVSSDRERKRRRCYSGCYAGQKFFHVDAMGRASICKIARNPNFNVLTTGADELFNNLFLSSKELLKKPKECVECSFSKCYTCAPLLKLHKKAFYIPEHICQREVSYHDG